ncbi:hypothetical protein [Plantactinospora sp. WMMB782]|uniref:hypothetical protein n=1 Tax=Plantactinospora sp. WMMB782 TaxID=3404121 RepID=UPI003B950192
MASFADDHAEWQRLQADAKSSGSSAAKIAAEQARIAVTHHPAVNRARGQLQHAVEQQRADAKSRRR